MRNYSILTVFSLRLAALNMGLLAIAGWTSARLKKTGTINQCLTNGRFPHCIFKDKNLLDIAGILTTLISKRTPLGKAGSFF